MPIGKVVGTFGLKGTLKIWPSTDFPERFDEGSIIWLGGRERKIIESQWHKKQVRVRVDGIKRIEDAENYIGQEVRAAALERKLDEDEFMVDDLLGLRVFDENGRTLGTVEEVMSGPAHDIYRIGSALVPAVSEFVKEIDLKSRTMTIAPIPGMFENED